MEGKPPGTSAMSPHYDGIMTIPRTNPSMKPLGYERDLWLFLVFALGILLVISVGCRRKDERPIVPATPIVATQTDWTNFVNASRATIITGDWGPAETAWMDLHLKAWNLKGAELYFWIEFQIEIVQETQADPLKREIRSMAIQELGNHPRYGIAYRALLKDGLSTNLFREPDVREMARQVLKKLDDYQP
jgi:hypothetical protein